MHHEIDFTQHNEEQQQVWDAFHAGRPLRVPVMVGCNPRILLLDPRLNPEGIRFEEYMTDPDIMLRVMIEFIHWVRHNLRFDQEMGLPRDGWRVWIDLQNVYEAAWFGAPVRFPENNCPYALPLLDDDNRNLLFDRGIPDPIYDGGWMDRNWSFYAYWKEIMSAGTEFLGRPIVEVTPAAMGTDGPFTLAVELRGENACLDLVADEEYFHRLMDFITEATITRLRAVREKLGQPVRTDDFGFADDSIALISADHFRDHVLPYHRRLVDAFWNRKGTLLVHLCGDASRHFPILHDELGATIFDTGYPIDLHEMRRQLGPDVLFHGGPPTSLLKAGPVTEIVKFTRELVHGEVARGRFVLREANNLAPCTPVEHIGAMYEAAKEYGRYTD